MPSQRPFSLPLRALLVAFMVVPPAAILLAIPWLREQPDGVVFLLSGIAAALTVVAAFVFVILQDRRLDEWHRSAARFSSQWGWTAGASLIALLLALPPARELIVSLVAGWAEVPDPDDRLVTLAFVFGFMATVLAQALCTVVLSVVWVGWKSRAPREPS